MEHKESTKTSKSGDSISLPQLQEPEFFPECWKSLLTGVVAYVDCRTDSDNRSKSIAVEIERLGGTTVSHFSKKVTHVIFKDGSKPIYDKAKKMGIPIVSYLWIVACKEKGEIVPFHDFPAISSQDYDSPFFKWRKTKSMQPKDLDEELKLAEKRLERKKKKIQKQANEYGSKVNDENSSCSPIKDRKSIIDSLIESSPLVQERIYQEFAAGKTCDEVFSLKKGEEDDFDTFFDTPLLIKFIAKNYYSPKDPPPSSVRKILSEVQTPKSSEPSNARTDQLSTGLKLNNEDQENTSPLSAILQSDNNRKRKTALNEPCNAQKKLKENDDDTTAEARDKLPRKKLFRTKFYSLGPEEVAEAKTPPETHVKTNLNHPCFSQTSDSNSNMLTEPSNTLKLHATSPGTIVPRLGQRRDSMADFRSHVLKKCHNLKEHLSRDNSINVVCTSLHTDEMTTVAQAVESLKGSKITDLVDDSTTHVVCGDSRRTLNVMRGVIRGVKLVTFQWVLDSMKENRWRDEENYGVERFAKRAAFYRQSRKNKRLFDECGSIYVSSKSPIPHRDLCDLISCAGGRLCNNSSKAALIIGQLKVNATAPCVNGTWVLDSIEQCQTLPLHNYLLCS